VPRVGEIGKLLGAKWKEMNDEEKRYDIVRSLCNLLEADSGAYSHTSTKLLLIKFELRKRRRRLP
jgi:hypothetical protein